MFLWFGTTSLCGADQRPGCASANPYNVLLSKNNYCSSFLFLFLFSFILWGGGSFGGAFWLGFFGGCVLISPLEKLCCEIRPSVN